MEKQFSALYSHYIIDGAAQDHTPGGILLECMKGKGRKPAPCAGTYSAIADETIDLPAAAFSSGCSSVETYLSMIKESCISKLNVDRYYPAASTKLGIAESVIGTLWREGNFRLGNIAIKAAWEWDTGPVGNMTAFFHSATAAGEYLYDLGVNLEEYTFRRHPGACSAEFTAGCANECGHHACGNAEETADDELFRESPFESRHPHMEDTAKCGNAMLPDKGSWLIYVPFDTCQFKLGGSVLSKATGHEGGASSEIQDPDYFIDCYEVIRELVEDGIVISGITAGRGGLLYAADRLCCGAGMTMDISGISIAYNESDPVRILFGEVPGVIIQIRDNDYDYVDAQLLLQDIAYYPLGHPLPSGHGIELKKDTKSGISGILESLINSQTSEGED